LERELLAKSNTLVVCDFDGSKKDDRDPDSSLVTRDLLVARVILGPEDYILLTEPSPVTKPSPVMVLVAEPSPVMVLVAEPSPVMVLVAEPSPVMVL